MHYDDMIEVCNFGGGHRTRLREDLVCLWGAPSHVYKGGGRRRPALEGAHQGGSPTWTPSPSRILPSSYIPPEGKEGGEKEKEGGGRCPHPLSNSDWQGV